LTSRSISSKHRRKANEFFLIKPTAPDEESRSKPLGALFLHQLWKYRVQKIFQQQNIDEFSVEPWHKIHGYQFGYSHVSPKSSPSPRQRKQKKSESKRRET
jgi:hypothetical protein